MRADYEAVVAYENKDATYNPRDTPVLLSEKDIQSRLAVLAALQVYAKSLVEMTKSVDTTDLDAASKSAGSDLSSVGNTLAPSVDKVLGISATSGAAKTSSTSTAPLTPEVRNGISTAIDALGQFLANRKVGSELPAKIEAMDAPVQTLAKTLEDDIETIAGIEQRDYDRILDLEKQFILEDAQTGNTQERRAEIMKLPELARQQSETDEKLTSLRKAIEHLAATHHELATEAQNKKPESLNAKLNDLSDAGKNLGKFYSSLPAK